MEESVPPGSVCCFCLTSHEDEALYGKFYKLQEITTHYFCLLLSSKVQQRGSDDEGILGFLANDIRAEVRRGKNLMCAYCHKRGATINCHNSKCKLHFHLPCGRAKDTFHQFFGEFKSFCFKHRKSQSIKKEVLKAMSGKQSTCSICLESVPATPSPNTLWAPCCSKEAWFHRLCIQRLALSAGYFFKCPLCNNTNRFVEAMRTCGIWIPEQDASWERDPNRYDGLLQRHNSCDAKSCRCRQGRTFHMETTKWEIKLCADCGSQGMHVHCGNLRVTQDWVCAICANVLSSKNEEEQKQTGKISISRQAIRARNRARRGLPARPVRRMTRLQQLQSAEEPEEDEGRTDNVANVATKTPIPSPGLIKGAASSSQKCPPPGPPKEIVPRPVKAIANKPREREEFVPQIVQPASENSDVEIIDVGDDSDDEVQQWKNKKNPLACKCKRRSRWSWHVRRPFGSRVSGCCYDRSKKYLHNGKSRSPRNKDSENDLLSRFFSTLASSSESSLQKAEPQCHHLLVISHYQVGHSSERSPHSNGSCGFEPSNIVNDFSSSCRRKKTPSRASWRRKRSPSSSYNDGTCCKMPSRKNVKLSPDSKVKAECSRIRCKSKKSGSALLLKTELLSKPPREKQMFRHKHYSLRSQSDTPKEEAITVRNALALAQLPAYQPVVVLEPLLMDRYRQQSTSRHRQHNAFRDRQRSASVERPVERTMRLQGGRSRREQFLMKNKSRSSRAVGQTPANFVKRSPVQTRSRSRSVKSCELPVKTNKAHNSPKNKKKPNCFNDSAGRTPRNLEKRSPVRTRSLSRSLKSCEPPVQTAEALNARSSSTPDTRNFHALNRNFSGLISSENPLRYNELFGNRTTSSVSSSTDSCPTPISDETDEEWIIHEDFIGDAMATISEDSCFSDETDVDVVVGENDIKDTIEKMTQLRGFGKCGMKTGAQRLLVQSTASHDNDDSSNSDVSSSLMQIHLSRSTSPTLSTSVLSIPFSSSLGLSHSFSHLPECVSPHSSSSSALIPFSFPAPSALSYSSPAHMDIPSFPNTAPQSYSVDSTSSLPSNSLTCSISMMPSESENLVSCKSKQNLPSQLLETLPSLPEPSESESANCLPSSFPSPRRSLRYSHNSVPSYNYRSVKKGLLDNCNPLCVRRLSPPPIFPKRNGSLTEMEYRIKARALTARKFVPMSRTATEQREVIRQIQALQAKQ